MNESNARAAGLCLCVALWAAGSGCVGAIDDPMPAGAASGGPARPAGSSPSPAGDSPAAAPGSAGAGMPVVAPGSAPGSPAPVPPSRPAARLRRLSRAQYNNTVRDLLGDATRPADQFVGEEAHGAFSGSEALAQAAPAVVEIYRATAERLAATAVRNPMLVPCQPTPATEDTCARMFIGTFGERAYRRPLGADEITALLELFRKVRVEADFTFGIQAVVAAMLQAPSFLYRYDFPPAGARAGTMVAVSQHDVASRLSYFLWNSMPDTDLSTAARAGALASPAQIEAQARRMLRDPRARDAILEFHAEWLLLPELDTLARNRTLHPEFSDDLRRAMREETVRFVGQVVLDGDAKLSTLLLSPRTFVNAPLGRLYGVAGPATGYAAVDLNPDQRAGVLTHASLLTLTSNGDGTSPTRRGKFVRDQLMCQPPPPPPPEAEFMLPRKKAGQTERERFREHVQNPQCAACHLLTDPIGFGFENYNAIGKFQAMDAGKPVDASGQVTASRDMDGAFVGAVALARKIAGSAQVRDCMVKKWFSFAHGHDDEAGDQVSVKAAQDLFVASGGDLRELMVAITRTEAFRTRLAEGS